MVTSIETASLETMTPDKILCQIQPTEVCSLQEAWKYKQMRSVFPLSHSVGWQQHMPGRGEKQAMNGRQGTVNEEQHNDPRNRIPQYSSSYRQRANKIK